jgi:hypothetical protein
MKRAISFGGIEEIHDYANPKPFGSPHSKQGHRKDFKINPAHKKTTWDFDPRAQCQTSQGLWTSSSLPRNVRELNSQGFKCKIHQRIDER